MMTHRGKTIYTDKGKAIRWDMTIPEWGLTFKIIQSRQLRDLSTRYGPNWQSILEQAILNIWPHEVPVEFKPRTAIHKAIYMLSTNPQHSGLTLTEGIPEQAIAAAKICSVQMKDSQVDGCCIIELIDYDHLNSTQQARHSLLPATVHQ